ncbi:MAG: hypothetical protein OEV48_11545, partial [Acidobacteriota bacterium]|nr:hypothetical protein [Acidobacteriota bacterium]
MGPKENTVAARASETLRLINRQKRKLLHFTHFDNREIGRPADAARGEVVSAPTATGEEEVMIRSRLTPVLVMAALLLLPVIA